MSEEHVKVYAMKYLPEHMPECKPQKTCHNTECQNVCPIRTYVRMYAREKVKMYVRINIRTYVVTIFGTSIYTYTSQKVSEYAFRTDIMFHVMLGSPEETWPSFQSNNSVE